MDVFIDTKKCVGCGLCEEVAPSIFTIGDYYARILRQPSNDEEVALIRIIQRDCPAGAIRRREQAERPLRLNGSCCDES